MSSRDHSRNYAYPGIVDDINSFFKIMVGLFGSRPSDY